MKWYSQNHHYKYSLDHRLACAVRKSKAGVGAPLLSVVENVFGFIEQDVFETEAMCFKDLQVVTTTD